jgi:hypothetical protein
MRIRYARWQGLVAAAAIVGFIVATHWHHPGLGAGVGLAVIVLLKGVEWLVRRIAGRNGEPS